MPHPNPGRRIWHIVVLWAILLFVAGLIRLWDLESIPPPLWRDEAKNGLDVLPSLYGLQ